jgi:hypothetical protein
MNIVFEVIAAESFKSAGTLHIITECAIPGVAKGLVTFFTVKQFRPCGLLDP